MKVAAGIALTALLALLQGCASAPAVPVPDFVGIASNACLPEAIIVAETFRRDGVKAKVMLIDTTAYSHAVVVFLQVKKDTGVEELWVWDANTRTTKVVAAFDKPLDVAKAWLDETLIEGRVLRASFL